MIELIYGNKNNKNIKAIIIEAFGMGNLPSNTNLASLIQEKANEGILILS